MELRIEQAHKLLDVEKFSRIYMLKNVKKLYWGYEAELQLAKFITFKCLVSTKNNQVIITEKSGKFIIEINIDKDEVVRIKVKSENPLLKEALELRIEKNLEKLKDVIPLVRANDKKRVVFMKSIGDHILDLRGTVCPVPEIETKKKLIELKTGESLEVLIDNPAAVEITLPEVSRLFNCRYEVFDMGDYVSFVFYKLSSTPTRTEFLEAVESKNGELLSQLIKNGVFRAFLYSYFDKIMRKITSDIIRKEDLRHETYGLITAAPIGRGWLLTAIVDKDKILAIRLDLDNQVLFGEEAIKRLPIEGELNLFYLYH